MRDWARDGITYRTGKAWTHGGLGWCAVKAAGDRWNPAEHPRDARGRFVRKNARVQLFGGGFGTVTGFHPRSGRFEVRRDSDGRTVRLVPAHITVADDAPPAPSAARRAPRGDGPLAAPPSTPGSPDAEPTLRPDLTTGHRNAIRDLNLDDPDAGHHPLVVAAATALQERRPLTADQAQALADAVRAARGDVPAARARTLDRIAGRLETVSAALHGIGAEHVPAHDGVRKTTIADVTVGDTIALPGRGGTAEIFEVADTKPWYGQFRMQLTGRDGDEHDRLVHPDTDVYLLPDLPPPTPVPPAEHGDEHVVADRLRPGDRILHANAAVEVVKVTRAKPGARDVTVRVAGREETFTVMGGGYPTVVRVARGDASKDQPWDSVLPIEDPHDISPLDLQHGDRARIPLLGSTVTGTVDDIAYVRDGSGTRGVEMTFRTDAGVLNTVALFEPERVERLSRGGDGAAERIAAERAAAEHRIAVDYVAAALQDAHHDAQVAGAYEARGVVMDLAATNDASLTGDDLVDAVRAKWETDDSWRRRLMASAKRNADAAAGWLAPDLDPEQRDALAARLRPMFLDAAELGHAQIEDRIIDTIRNASAEGTEFNTRAGVAALAMGPLIDRSQLPPVVGVYDQAAEGLASAMPDLNAPERGVDVVVPDLPEGTSLADRMAAYREALGGEFGKQAVERVVFKPPRLSDLQAGHAPETERVRVHIPDRAADGGPGETAMRHLAIIRAAGKDLDAELQRRIDADLAGADTDELEKANRQVKERLAELVSLQRSAKDLFASQHGFDNAAELLRAYTEAGEANNDAEQERLGDLLRRADRVAADASRELKAEFQQLVRRRDNLRAKAPVPSSKRFKALMRKHTLAMLAEVRETGVGGVRLDYVGPRNRKAKKETDPLVQAMRWAEDGYPTDWLNKVNANPRPWVLKQTQRGYHNHYSRTIALSQSYTNVEGAVNDFAHVADHELGHAMEYAVPGLSAAEEALLWDRTSTGPIGSRTREALTPIFGAGSDETAYKDDFPEHYTGKDYGGRAWEVFTTAKESLTSGSSYLDDDLRHWVLGVLAVL